MELVNYQCPNCGAGLKYDPASGKFRCEYCLAEFTEEEMTAAEKETGNQAGKETEKLTEKEEEKEAGTQAVYTCPNCGAELVTDETTAASFCYYCHSPVILSGRLSGEFLPDYVIPFSFDREKAMEIFSGWIRMKKLLPRDFFSESQIEKFSGVYFPYLIYSCRVEGSVKAEAETQRVWTMGNTRYTEHKKYQVEREGELEVRHLARNALSRNNRDLVEGILPFDMEKMLPFHTGYLSGFLAEKRDMDSSGFEPQVREEVSSYTAENLKASMTGYNSVRILDQKMEIRDPSWKYALFPVWTMTYRDPKKGKIYYFTMNGQTGKINGELPVDQRKLALLFAGVFLPVFLFLLMGGWFL